MSATIRSTRNNTLRIADTTADAAKCKRKRTAARRKAKRASERLAVLDWQLRTEVVFQRDGGRCRVCRADRGPLGSAHHICYRSAGGSDALANLVWLCLWCRRDEHEHRIKLTGTADDLRIERRR